MNARRSQGGVVLLVGLIILVVLSLLAIGSIRSTTLEERMTGNSQDQQSAAMTTLPARSPPRSPAPTATTRSPWSPMPLSTVCGLMPAGCRSPMPAAQH